MRMLFRAILIPKRLLALFPNLSPVAETKRSYLMM